MLEIGSVADIQLEDTEGHKISVADYRGKENVFLYFMRALSCAQCNAHVRSLAKSKADFDAANVRIIIAVPEGNADAGRSCAAAKPTRSNAAAAPCHRSCSRFHISGRASHAAARPVSFSSGIASIAFSSTLSSPKVCGA